MNTTSTVKLYQFAKVFWDYTDSTERGQSDAAQNGLASEKSGSSHRKLSFTSVGAGHMAQVALPSRTTRDYDNKKPERAELLCRTHFLSTPTKCQTLSKHAQVRVIEIFYFIILL